MESLITPQYDRVIFREEKRECGALLHKCDTLLNSSSAPQKSSLGMRYFIVIFEAAQVGMPPGPFQRTESVSDVHITIERHKTKSFITIVFNHYV